MITIKFSWWLLCLILFAVPFVMRYGHRYCKGWLDQVIIAILVSIISWASGITMVIGKMFFGWFAI